jgi:hypothetical protein
MLLSDKAAYLRDTFFRPSQNFVPIGNLGASAQKCHFTFIAAFHCPILLLKIFLPFSKHSTISAVTARILNKQIIKGRLPTHACTSMFSPTGLGFVDNIFDLQIWHHLRNVRREKTVVGTYVSYPNIHHRNNHFCPCHRQNFLERSGKP